MLNRERRHFDEKKKQKIKSPLPQSNATITQLNSLEHLILDRSGHHRFRELHHRRRRTRGEGEFTLVVFIVVAVLIGPLADAEADRCGSHVVGLLVFTAGLRVNHRQVAWREIYEFSLVTNILK